MQIWYLLLLIIAIIPSRSVSAQSPLQPVATTDSTCLNDCLKQGLLVFAASNLRNFQKVAVHIEEFCNTREKLLKCAQTCTNGEVEKLTKMISLSAYVCKDKLEEFRLVKECMGSKEDTDAVNKCATECGYPSDANIQLDSSSAAPVNPFVFIDSAAQVCLTLECVIKCSVAESNKICAGSGYLFRDVGFKQVQEASDKLQNDASNSSSATQQLIKQYLKTLPQQCIYIINPTNYDTTFPQHEGNDEINTVTPKTSKTEGNTEEEGVKQVTSRISHTDSDVVITRIFNEGFTTPSSEVSGDDNVMTKEIGKEGTIRIEVAETGDEYDIAMKSSPSSTSEEVVSTVAEGADSTSMKAKTSALEDENDGGENNDETSHLQHPTTPVTIEEITERTIVVMNDDRDQEINTNTIMKHTAVGQQQQDATKQGARERITLSLLLFLSLISFYLSSQ